MFAVVLGLGLSEFHRLETLGDLVGYAAICSLTGLIYGFFYAALLRWRQRASR
jgi:hypothetical protein